jgi:hypothetical protein
MSDALAAHTVTDAALIRCPCLAHGRRKFTELEEAFPEECAVGIEALRQVFDHEEVARGQQFSAAGRLAYHQCYSGPIMAERKGWLEQQDTERTVEPNSSLGKAFQYLLGHWQTFTRFLTTPGAPLENKAAERALKLAIRQRHNSLFYATEHGAYVGSLLTSLIAPCRHTGGNALDYLVALQEHRSAVWRHPAMWLPWHYGTNLAPPEGKGRQSSAIPACGGTPFQSKMANSRAAKRAVTPAVWGHQVKRPCERRLLHYQNDKIPQCQYYLLVR